MANRQKADWQTRFEAQVRKATGDFVAWLAGGDLWYTCGCAAHWITPECGVDCVLTHRQYEDWNLCTWPPEMLKYWDPRNWRETTPPVDYPDLSPSRFHVVFQDLDKGIVWFEAMMSGEQVAQYRKILAYSQLVELYIRQNKNLESLTAARDKAVLRDFGQWAMALARANKITQPEVLDGTTLQM